MDEENVLILESKLIEKIYGGTKIQEYFGFKDAIEKKIGEFWAISAHPNGPSIVTNGKFAGKTLSELWDEHKELFSNSKLNRFPLLVKINAITSPVSVQVHPNDEYALKNEDDLGKAEFCIFLEVEPNTKIVRGHTAKNQLEFRDKVNKGEWDDLLIRKEVHTGDFVYTPPGIIHGVEGKMLMAEVQQSSDVTYRLYDYQNVGADGKPRELHIEKSIEVTTIPHVEPKIELKSKMIGDTLLQEYCDNEFFKVEMIDCHSKIELINKTYSLITVLSGNGLIKMNHENYVLKPGVNLIVTSLADDYVIDGEIKVLVTQPPKE